MIQLSRLRGGVSADIDTLQHIDSDASELFESAGLHLDAERELELSRAERSRWLRCLENGDVLVAVDPSGREVGFAALGERDREPYLDQLSVLRASMGQGIGRALLYASIKRVSERGAHFLWLTTYGHLSWNRPFYERHGFAVVSQSQCGEEMQRELLFERSLLPDSEHRVAMRRDLRTIVQDNVEIRKPPTDPDDFRLGK
jgi:GNAT superfamily N-acetyltransferase